MLEQEVRIGQVLSTLGCMNLNHWKEMLWNVGWAGPIPGRDAGEGGDALLGSSLRGAKTNHHLFSSKGNKWFQLIWVQGGGMRCAELS